MRTAPTNTTNGTSMNTRTSSSDTVAETIRETERARPSALVGADVHTAEALHSDDFELITPIGARLNKQQYLGAIATGQINYVHWQPGPIEVRVHDTVALLRYTAELEVVFGGHHVAATHYWHTDSYALTNEGWKAVWSQATEIR